MINFRFWESFSIIKLWICIIRFSLFFLDVITSLSVIERHLCQTAAFIVSDTALFNRFLSKVDWIFEKAIIIAVMYETSGVYLIS